jgi:hypothetical protein
MQVRLFIDNFPSSFKLILNPRSLVQMAKIDENQEVIAQIRMAVDNYDNTQRLEEFEDTADEELPGLNVSFLSGIGGSHWKLGAPDHATTSKLLQDDILRPRQVASSKTSTLN